MSISQPGSGDLPLEGAVGPARGAVVQDIMHREYYVFSQGYTEIKNFLTKCLMYEMVCSVQEQMCCRKEQVCHRIANKV